MTRQIFIFLVLLALECGAQKYNFVNWTVEDGLIQSQASFISQDNFRQLWIGTEGGISRFDGKRFTGYTVQDGLPSNRITSMFCDKEGKMWIGTNQGLCVYNGSQVKKILAGDVPLNSIFSIAFTDKKIFALSQAGLFEIAGEQARKCNVTGDTLERFTSLYQGYNNRLLVYAYRRGIFSYQNGEWKKLTTDQNFPVDFFVRQFYITANSDTLLLSNKGIFTLKKNSLVPFNDGGNLKNVTVLAIAEDSKQDIWIGTETGVYKTGSGKLIHLGEKSGFTDNAVNYIFKDAENNLWFATNGEGIYKFRENTFTYYDKSSGLASTIVMGVIQTGNGKVYTGGYGSTLYEIDGNGKLLQVKYKSAAVVDGKINCLYADNNNTVLIGTLNRGAWSYSETNGFKRITSSNEPDLMIKGVTCFLRDNKNNLLISGQQGLFLLDQKDSLRRISINAPLVTTLRQFDDDHILAGTSKGIYLLDQNYHAEPFYEDQFGNSSVLCLARNGDNVWVGTTDKGVLNWDFRKKKMLNYNTGNGLPSNFIYSLDVSTNNLAWIGTGFGISNLQLDEKGNAAGIKNYGRSDGLLGMECNHNSLLKAADSSLWFGTTKGLFHFNPSARITEKNQPFVILRSVKLFSSEIKDSSLFESRGAWFQVPDGLNLAHYQNHLTFELSAIYFTNPDNVLYKYKLEGIDKNFTTSGNPLIVYPSLPPGKYHLIVQGLTKGGILSSNEINYGFEIKKAFYQTALFQVAVILLLLSAGAMIAYVITRGRQKRKQKEKEILEKIREEEFIKLRQRTAEDFHDEMGNSLTRISVLTDVLKAKINGKEQDITKLVQQIKENTTTLYNGSRDIIWSLNSQNDGLYEVAGHVRDIGNEMFQDTDVEFNFNHNIPAYTSLKLKLDYSRNLTMIFKEAYSNILKHSSATIIKISIDLVSEEDLHVFISDNGKGINPDKKNTGNGLGNMENRARRMNGKMNISSASGKGTEIHIILKNIYA